MHAGTQSLAREQQLQGDMVLIGNFACHWSPGLCIPKSRVANFPVPSGDTVVLTLKRAPWKKLFIKQLPAGLSRRLSTSLFLFPHPSFFLNFLVKRRSCMLDWVIKLSAGTFCTLAFDC
jgi:hypothetical protein